MSEGTQFCEDKIVPLINNSNAILMKSPATLFIKFDRFIKNLIGRAEVKNK